MARNGKPRKPGKPGMVKQAPQDTAVTFEAGGVRISIFRESLGKLRIISTERLKFIDPKDLTPPPPSH